ncbi:MAG: hypothetical protein KF693_06400 [Nitrospira sp.]|nr:hypothetical protein [Nitrospira sp.]
MPSKKTADRLMADFMRALVPLEKYLKRGRPLTALQVESLSLAYELFGEFLDAWKLQHGYNRRHKREKSAGSWFADITNANKPVKPNPAAVALGRMGGLKGGIARAKKLSAARRVAIARLAVTARWARTSKRN